MYYYYYNIYAGTEGIELPTFSELVDNAVHLYGPPAVGARSTSFDGTPFQVYPCMKFTCPGRITKLMFVTNVTHGGSLNQPMLWPELSLWRNECDSDVDGCKYG